MRIDARKHRNLGDKAATDLFVDKSLLKTRVPPGCCQNRSANRTILLKRRRYAVNAMNHTDGFKSYVVNPSLACSLRFSFPCSCPIFSLFPPFVRWLHRASRATRVVFLSSLRRSIVLRELNLPTIPNFEMKIFKTRLPILRLLSNFVDVSIPQRSCSSRGDWMATSRVVSSRVESNGSVGVPGVLQRIALITESR